MPAALPVSAVSRYLARQFGFFGAALALVVGSIDAFAAATDGAAGLVGRPLAARSGPRGKTLFVEQAPDATGVRTENRYADPEMWGKRYHEFEIGAIGTGVTIGDYDGDSLPDLFVVSKTETCRLFRNLGNFKFEDVTERAGVGDQGTNALIWKQGATFADVNNDGRLDLYVCRFDAPNLLYLNQGDGTFKEAAQSAGLDVRDACTMAAFCDYDRDGWLDVYVLTNLLNNAEHPGGQRDYLFHNNRDGTFTNVTDRAGLAPGGSQGNSATWWDFNNDGWPDLYVANDFAVADALYRNNRDGTFTNVADSVIPRVPYSSMGSDLGDVNNDGLVDFIATDMASSTHEKDQRGMATTRARNTDAGDNSTSVQQYLRNTLFLNTDTDRCLEAARLAGLDATDWTWSVRFEDLDNDGRLDLHVTNGMHREAHNADLITRMMASESATERVRAVRTSPVFAETNFAFRNVGDLQFESVGPIWGLDQKGVSFGAAFGDLDGDGDLDVLFANYQAGATLLRNDNDTGHRVVFELRGTRSNRFGIGARVRLENAAGVQVRELSLARGYMSSSEPIVHFGLGDDPTITRLIVSWPSGQVQTFEHLAADQRYTITEPADAPALTSAPPPKPTAQFTEVSAATGLALAAGEDQIDELAQQALIPMRFNRRGPALAAGDVDGDGRDDLVVGGTTQSPAQLLHNSGGQFTPANSAISAQAPLNDGPVLVFDADGDGAADIFVSRGGNSLPLGASEYQPVLWLNDGHGAFRPAASNALPSLSLNAGAAAAADFDHSGHLGVFIGGRLQPGDYPQPPPSALLANRGGRFEDVTDQLAPGLRTVGMVTSALWSDVDGDGWADLVLALEWGTVKYFHNEQGKAFVNLSEQIGFAAAGAGWWTSLASADFNGDGCPDFVAGNVGLNTQYRADAGHPAVLFVGDFKDGGAPQLVEGYYEGEKLFPWRTRKDLSLALPSILKRYPRNDYYARATLKDIFGEEKLNAAQRFAATELRSGVFLSGTDGTYHFEPLPRLAQISPFQGIAALDLDGDGHADIYAAQNSYAPSPTIGRFDGGLGLLLRGDGRGHFTPAPLADSGLVVPGNAKAVIALDADQDGWPDLLVSRNHSTTVAFHNAGVAGRHSFAVRLRGPKTNSSAIGASLRVTMKDGSVQVAEIRAGSSYYSQSVPLCFFGYLDNNPPVKLQITWPAGETTTQELSHPSGTLNVSTANP